MPIFTYMNRFYIEAKLHTDLKTELTKIFSSLVADKHVARLVLLMAKAQALPFSVRLYYYPFVKVKKLCQTLNQVKMYIILQVHPEVMATLCKHLYTLNPEYTEINPSLFSSFLPNIMPKMTEEDLQAQMDQDRRLQESLRAQGWGEADADTKKRILDDDPGHNGRG